MLVALSAIIRAAISLGVPAPAVLPDELVYSELAKSVAAGERPSIRGVPVFGWGEVYPTLIAPAWLMFHDLVSAYRAALILNAVIMSLAAVPADPLARLFVSSRASLLVALTTLLVPSMSYTRLVMTENAAYPAFILAILLMARAVRTPTGTNQSIALAGIGLLTFTRIQGIALVVAYVASIAAYGALSPAGSGARTRVDSCGAARCCSPPRCPPSLCYLGAGKASSAGSVRGLETFDALHPSEIPRWAVYLVAGLLLYVAVVPAAASIVVMRRGFARDASEPMRLFAAIVLPVLVVVIGAMSVVSASFDVDGHETNERYVFDVVPLLFVGLALWVREGLPRPRFWVCVIAAVSCTATMVLPIGRLAYNAWFQSVALLPLLDLSLSRAGDVILVGAFTVGCLLLWVGCRRDQTRLLWLFIATWMAAIGLVALNKSSQSASHFANAFAGAQRAWVDAAVPRGDGRTCDLGSAGSGWGTHPTACTSGSWRQSSSTEASGRSTASAAPRITRAS